MCACVKGPDNVKQFIKRFGQNSVQSNGSAAVSVVYCVVNIN